MFSSSLWAGSQWTLQHYFTTTQEATLKNFIPASFKAMASPQR
jgi:hypothetical protein